ncbi:HK97 family phage prohead protease [Devosia sp.]|uniref:HK97 family phage prohead protease n=1 Tax=Devosia sp. TaxID=1871048 RepID=UPI001AC2FE6B|nr:HK97 family phage prohead protease [Devosia sp.]MBN9334963.1 HK97 family phage prohead protease [Devosia sp.]
MTETKSLTVEKMDEVGQGLARIAILSSVDHDGDTYVKGAFSWAKGGEQWVPILPAHNRDAMPLGKARVYEQGDEVFAELYLNLNTEAGRDWHETLKFDLEKGGAVQEWSYGYSVLEAVKERRGSEMVRVLKRLKVDEVSPVVRGAGVGTGTLSMKARQARAQVDSEELSKGQKDMFAAMETLSVRKRLTLA